MAWHAKVMSYHFAPRMHAAQSSSLLPSYCYHIAVIACTHQSFYAGRPRGRPTKFFKDTLIRAKWDDIENGDTRPRPIYREPAADPLGRSLWHPQNDIPTFRYLHHLVTIYYFCITGQPASRSQQQDMALRPTHLQAIFAADDYCSCLVDM